jgi:hypothetical protein
MLNFYLFRLGQMPSISNGTPKNPKLAYKAGNGLCCQPLVAINSKCDRDQQRPNESN